VFEAPEAAFGLGGSASALVRGLEEAVESKVGMGCAASTSGMVTDRSSGGSIKSAVPSSTATAESIMVGGLPRAETTKSSSNSSP